jgi:hypothetical protein
MNEQYHEMILEKTHPSGADEWYCPTCGRRFLMQLTPLYEMIILEAGDQYAQHSGSTGSLRVGPLQVEETQFTDELRLGPWLEWLEEVNFENRWGKDT